MLRQTPCRNQRARGFRVKHGLQIFLLTAICIWLLYQIKHSHDKKREMEESSSKISNKIVGNEDGRFNFGRRDLPRAEQIESVNDTQVEEEKEETEEEDEQEPKQEEALDEDERGVGDDSIDEKDQYRGEEEGEEEEKDVKDEADGADEGDNVRDFQEAWEENYRRDDVAGSVHRETQTTDSETGDDESINKADQKEEEKLNFSGETKNFIENNSATYLGEVDNSKVNVSGVDMAQNKSMPYDNIAGVGMTENGNMTAENHSPNVTVVEKKESEDINHSTSTTTGSSNNETEMKNNLTTSTEFSTTTEPQISDNQGVTQNNSEQGDAVPDNASPQNTTVTLELNMTDKIEPNTTDKIEPITTDKTEPMNNNQNVGNVATEQTKKADGTPTSITTGNGDGSTEGVVSNNSTSDHVITEEEKDARTDLSTLAESVGQSLTNGDDEAVE